jgi:hypothetical protein
MLLESDATLAATAFKTSDLSAGTVVGLELSTGQALVPKQLGN